MDVRSQISVDIRIFTYFSPNFFFNGKVFDVCSEFRHREWVVKQELDRKELIQVYNCTVL